MYAQLCTDIGVPSEYTYYFALFLMEDKEGRKIIRRLQEFECPFVTIQRAEPHHVIMV
jgi:hypothetical protein